MRNAETAARPAPTRSPGDRTRNKTRAAGGTGPKTRDGKPGGTTAATAGSGPTADPAARKRDRRRAGSARRARSRRRRLEVLAAAAAVTVVGVGGLALAKSSALDVDAVRVMGAEHADTDQITTMSGLFPGQPLVEVSPSSVEHNVESVPWVDQARVRRGWLGTVTITVTERRPVMALPTGQGRYVLVDGSGRQLELVGAPMDGQIPVTGIEVSGVPGDTVTDRARMVVAVNQQLTPAVAEQVTGIGFDDETMVLDLAIGGKARLGDDRELPEKLVSLETVLARVDLACVAVIDVEVPSAPTVRRAPSLPPGETAANDGGEVPDPGTGGC
ncbi:MAG: cell division protein FtsQ/DivIB [Acidimicrobiales bacterium]